tara:strand:- start:1504 stop:1695 length:192 start_codon:yes stop_codon:yes gene_type:complete
MSGDVGLHEQPIVFYHEEMTEAKKILLQSRGIKLSYLDKKTKNDDTDSISNWKNFCKYESRPE